MVIMAYLQMEWGGVIDYAIILSQECLARNLGDVLA